MATEIRLSESEKMCLRVLVDQYQDENEYLCVFFSHIQDQTGLSLIKIKRAIHSLIKKGLAEYQRGLFDDDGMIAGSGHCATKAGAKLFREVDELKYEKPNKI